VTRSVTFALLVGAVLLPACSTEEPSAPPREDVPYSGDLNWTPEESAAWRATARPGWLVLHVTLAGTGEPVTDCTYSGVRFAFDKRRVPRKPFMMVDRFGPRPATPDGRYRWKMAAGWHQVRLGGRGIRKTWTPVFEIREGEETRLELAVKQTNRLRVRVFDEQGKPLEEGGVSLDGDGFRAGMHISKGIGEMEVDVDEVTVSVGRIFLEEYARQSVTIPLKPGEWNEVTIRLRR